MSKTKRNHKSRTHQYQDLIPLYEANGQPWPGPLELVIEWAVARGLIALKPVDPIKIMKRELAQALRVDHEIDQEGRRVRRYHPYLQSILKEGKMEQLVIWGTMRNMTREAMHGSLQYRRDYIRYDCFQLEMDRESYNQFHNQGDAIQLSMNFQDDMAEMKESMEHSLLESELSEELDERLYYDDDDPEFE